MSNSPRSPKRGRLHPRTLDRAGKTLLLVGIGLLIFTYQWTAPLMLVGLGDLVGRPMRAIGLIDITFAVGLFLFALARVWVFIERNPGLWRSISSGNTRRARSASQAQADPDRTTGSSDDSSDLGAAPETGNTPPSMTVSWRTRWSAVGQVLKARRGTTRETASDAVSALLLPGDTADRTDVDADTDTNADADAAARGDES